MTQDKKTSTGSKKPVKHKIQSDSAGLKAPDCVWDDTKQHTYTKRKIEITEAMLKTINTSQELITDGCSKMDAAKEAYGRLTGYTRSQILHVFIKGCGLSKAGSSTYYQNIKKKKTATK